MKNLNSKINSELVEIALNKVLSGYNFKHYSDHIGNFDRNFWHTKTISDFPSSTYQQTILGITKYCKYLEHDKKNNNILTIRKLNEIIKNGILNWCNIQNNDGSQNEYYKNDRSFCPTTFTTFAIAKSFMLKLNLFDIYEKELIQKKIKKSCNWIFRNLYFESCNQLIAAHNALYFGSLILKDKEVKKKQINLKRKIIKLAKSKQLLEYGGYDTGYIFISLDLIHEYFLTKKKDKDISFLANYFCKFLINFLHPDGTSGGTYNSRNTNHIMPFACLIYNSLKTENSRILYSWSKSNIRNIVFNNPLKINDKYFFYFYFNSLINFFLFRGNLNFVVKKKIQKRKNFFDKTTQMGKIITGNLSIFFNLKKNVCFKVYKKDKLIINEEGFNLISKNKFLTSQCQSGELVSKSFNKHNKIRIIVKGRLQKINDFIPLEKNIVAFKFFAKYILNNEYFATLFNKFIKKKFLKKKIYSNILTLRNLNIEKNKIEIIDEIKLPSANYHYRYKKIENFSEVYSDSSNFFEYKNIKFLEKEKKKIIHKDKKLIIKREFNIE